MLKKIGTLILSICLLVPGSTVLAANNSNTEEPIVNNEAINYWKGKFDSFEDQINSGNLGALVGSSEIYIKYTPKNENIDLETATEDDFNKLVFDKDGYVSERLKEVSPFAIGPFEPNGTCSWLRLDLQVYETSTRGIYSAISFWEWKTDPQFRLKDINGIYVSSELGIGEVTPTNPKVAEFRFRETNSNTWTVRRPFVSVSQYGNGAATTIDLPGDSELFNHDYFMGMLQVPVEFVNTGSTAGRIYTCYSHTRLSVGDLSFDSEGKPSFGITSKIDEFSGSVRITK